MQRVWSVQRNGDFQGRVVVADGGSRALVATIQEAISPEMASSVRDVVFTPPAGRHRPAASDGQVQRGDDAGDDLRIPLPGPAAQGIREVRGPAHLGRRGSRVRCRAGLTRCVLRHHTRHLVGSRFDTPLGWGERSAPGPNGSDERWVCRAPGLPEGRELGFDEDTIAAVSGAFVRGAGAGTAALTASLGQATVPVGIVVAEAAPQQPAAQPKADAPEPAAAAPAPAAGSSARVPAYGPTWGTYWFFYAAGPAEVASTGRGSGCTPYGPGGVAFYGCSGPNAISVQRWVVEPMNFHQFTTSGSQAATFRSEGRGVERRIRGVAGLNAGRGPALPAVLAPLGAPQFTTSLATVNAAVAAGWQKQGIAWYAYPPYSP